MKLTLFTLPNCPKCPAAKELALTVTNQREDVSLEVLDLSDSNNMIIALMMQIASTPSFAIDGTPLFVGELPTLTELNNKIEEHKRRLTF